jgi:CitMHS family citrate-Mg2+:H+ or citrate-Ca2+:H+ symporter
MLVLAGIVILALLLILILKSPMLPGNVMALVPLVVALCFGMGFGDTMLMMHEGISDILVVAALFMFATIFFGVMSDVGLFDPIIRFLMKRVGNSVFGVVGVTALIALVGHIDGQGITTLIITVPPMIIIFDKLNISRTLMALVFSTVVPTMNMIPWGGPTVRAAGVIGEDVMVLYKALLPVQVIGLIISFVILYLASKAEEKKGNFLKADTLEINERKLSEEEIALKRPQLFWINAVVTLIVVIALFIGIPSYITFLIGCAIILPLNFRTVKEQNARIKAHAGNILLSIYTIIGAGALLGIMEGSGMFTAIAEAFVSIIPASMGGFIDIIIGLLITPLGFLLSADALIYGIMPVMVNIGQAFSIPTNAIAGMFVAGHCYATGLCLTTPSVYLGLGLMGLEYKQAFKANAKWILLIGSSTVLLASFLIH